MEVRENVCMEGPKWVHRDRRRLGRRSGSKLAKKNCQKLVGNRLEKVGSRPGLNRVGPAPPGKRVRLLKVRDDLTSALHQRDASRPKRRHFDADVVC